MSRILKVDNGTVVIGTDDGGIENVPFSALNFSAPRVGENVDIYRNGDQVIVSRADAPGGAAPDAPDPDAYTGDQAAGMNGGAQYQGQDAGYAYGAGPEQAQYANAGYQQYSDPGYQQYANSGYQQYSNAGYQGQNDPYGQSMPPQYYGQNIRTIDKHIFVWIGCFLFGCLGVDRFMRGQVGLGILKLLTAGGCGIWWLVDFIIGLVKAYGDAFNNSDNLVFINKYYAE
ncbi:MAG: TM2 domain-containing protein [Anaerovoracaceae bacterium]|nr:TM2 domain-containing protein [Anaerovoracaceae bacterium]